MATNLDNSGRAMLNEYLEKPLELDSGVLSTQVNMSVTSLSAGGVTGRFVISLCCLCVYLFLIIKGKGWIIINDGTTDRVIIGYQEGGF